MIQSNRIVVVQCTRNKGAEIDPGFCVNFDSRILTDACTASQMQALQTVIAPYIVTPVTPQWSFGPDTTTVRLRFNSQLEADSVVSSLIAGTPAPQYS